MKRPRGKALPVAPRHPRRRATGTTPRTPDEAIGDLARAMKHQAHLHSDLDARRVWASPAAVHLEHVRLQVRELKLLLSALEEPHLDPLRARRVRQTCANCANYLAFLAAHARRRRR